MAMAVSFSPTRVSAFGGITARLGKIRKRHLIVCALSAIAALAIFLLLTDGYLFYTTVIVAQVPQAVSLPKRSSLLSQDIDEVIRLLDARRQKLDGILNNERQL